jgi:hypothetical protein
VESNEQIWSLKGKICPNGMKTFNRMDIFIDPALTGFPRFFLKIFIGLLVLTTIRETWYKYCSLG